MVQGATGYLVLGALALVFAHGIARWRSVGVAVLAVAVAAALLTQLPGPFKQRADMISRELQGWDANEPQNTSIGLRLEYTAIYPAHHRGPSSHRGRHRRFPQASSKQCRARA